MQKRSKTEEEDRDRKDSLTDLIRTGAQQLIAQALKVEVTELLATYADQRNEQGHARVVLSGHQPAREIQTGIGPVRVQVPKVRSRHGELGASMMNTYTRCVIWSRRRSCISKDGGT